MRLTVGLALTLAIMTCGAQARDMQSIEHSGELKVGVPGRLRAAGVSQCRRRTAGL
ncbi:putative ABC-type amino acid transport/signal transduction systems periplasmic component [Klebsiella pneumoniae]|uniref:Putative ABC-type amino acid transport/signal transduction systems periplasmic component n=1 Tax=Klebsiella pneumoniae TaxID=573 RepID=A0A377VWR7_KLEPN|nr:putative ABC-type amino acid transport/signal transduction systems periplasmic component [Klebsiella pneumoniae]